MSDWNVEEMPKKLRDLALWIDVKYPNDTEPDVQNDLRRLAAWLENTGVENHERA